MNRVAGITIGALVALIVILFQVMGSWGSEVPPAIAATQTRQKEFESAQSNSMQSLTRKGNRNEEEEKNPKRTSAAMTSTNADLSLNNELSIATKARPPSEIDDRIIWDSVSFNSIVETNLRERAALWRDMLQGEDVSQITNDGNDNNRKDYEKEFVDTVDAVTSIRQCRVLGSPALTYLARYLTNHQRRGASTSSSARGHRQQQEMENVADAIGGRLIYSCESNKKKHFCGGMGDRFRGIISAFYMALLSNRRFELYSPVPVPLQKHLHPHLLNWIPSVLFSSSRKEEIITESSVHDSISSIPSDLSLMSIKKHSSYLRKLDGMTIPFESDEIQSASSSSSSLDKPHSNLRLQTNSVGIDMFLSASKTPRLIANKRRMFHGMSSSSSEGIDPFEQLVKKRLKMLDSDSDASVLANREQAHLLNQLNISTYFGCLYEILFAPSEVLLEAVSKTLNGPPRPGSSDDNGSRIVSYITPTVGGGDGHNRWNALKQSIVSHNAARSKLSSSHWDRLVFAGTATVQLSQQRQQQTNTIPLSSHRPFLFLRQPYISLQVRVGGALAKGMKEPFRTPPDAFPLFYEMLDKLFEAATMIRPIDPSANNDGAADAVGGVNAASSSQNAPPWSLFVSSDAEAFINETALRYGQQQRDVGGGAGGGRSGKVHVRYVSGNEAFLHTDTLNLGDIDASRWAQTALRTKEKAHFLTLLNHYILGLGSHMVMAQSGFGDTAFWRMRRDASCLFVDMTNLRHAWQHHLSYTTPPSRNKDAFSSLSAALNSAQRDGFGVDSQTGKLRPKIGHHLVEASALKNRVVDVKVRDHSPFYG